MTPGAMQVDGDAGHDLVDAEGDGGQGEEQTAEGAAERAATMAAHGPQCHPAQPANQVPRIIMPSRPMLTTPTRSAEEAAERRRRRSGTWRRPPR